MTPRRLPQPAPQPSPVFDGSTMPGLLPGSIDPGAGFGSPAGGSAMRRRRPVYVYSSGDLAVFASRKRAAELFGCDEREVRQIHEVEGWQEYTGAEAIARGMPDVVIRRSTLRPARKMPLAEDSR